MAQVKDMAGPPAHLPQNALRFRGHFTGLLQQQRRVEVSLHPNARGQAFSKRGHGNGPIDAEHLRAGSQQRIPVVMRAPAKNNDRRFPSQCAHNVAYPAA